MPLNRVGQQDKEKKKNENKKRDYFALFTCSTPYDQPLKTTTRACDWKKLTVMKALT